MIIRMMKRLLVMNLLAMAASQSHSREVNLLDAILVDEAEDSGVSVVEGSDGFPGFRFDTESSISRPFNKYLNTEFFPSFSLRADFKLDSKTASGFIFAIGHPSSKEVSVGLEASGVGEKETNVSLHLTAPSPDPGTGGDSVVSSFLIPVKVGSWTHLSMSVFRDSVSMYVDCELLETVSLPEWNNHLHSDSILYLGQSGSSSQPRHFNGIIERLKLYEDAELAPATCTTSFKGFRDDENDTSADLDPDQNLDDLFAGLLESSKDEDKTADDLPAPSDLQDVEEASGDVELLPSTTKQPDDGDGDAEVSPVADSQKQHDEKECCLRGLPGIPGMVGEKGERGAKGDSGPPGAVTSPSQLTDDELDRLIVRALESGRLDSLKGDEGMVGLSGVQGPPGLPGVTGPPGPPGPKGEVGERGDGGLIGFKGDKGDRGPPGTTTVLQSTEPGSRGERGLPGVKGDKGRRGARGYPGPPGTSRSPPPPPPVKGEKGEPGEGKVLFVTGPPGPPGLSIVGEKGEPGEDCITYGPPSVRQGRLARPDAFYSQQPDHDYKIVPGAVTFPDLDSMAQMTEVMSVGTIGYLINEEAVLVRMKSGWQYVALGGVVNVVNGVVASPRRESSVVGKVAKPDDSHRKHLSPSHSTNSTPGPLLTDTPSLRLAALNQGYTGDMGGQRAVDLACYKQSKRAGLSGTFRAFLATSIQNLNSLVRHSDSSAPVVNIKGELLFNSWNEIFSSGGLAGLKPDSSVYRFDGENVLSQDSWDENYVWHGGSSNGELLADKQCEGWTSESAHSQGSATSLSTGTLLSLPCSQRLAVLCIEVSASKDRDSISTRHSRHSPPHTHHRFPAP